MDKPKCSYCGRGLTAKYNFSYGVPGLPRIYGCKRWWCKLLRRLPSVQFRSPIVLHEKEPRGYYED